MGLSAETGSSSRSSEPPVSEADKGRWELNPPRGSLPKRSVVWSMLLALSQVSTLILLPISPAGDQSVPRVVTGPGKPQPSSRGSRSVSSFGLKHWAGICSWLQRLYQDCHQPGAGVWLTMWIRKKPEVTSGGLSLRLMHRLVTPQTGRKMKALCSIDRDATPRVGLGGWRDSTPPHVPHMLWPPSHLFTGPMKAKPHRSQLIPSSLLTRNIWCPGQLLG